MRRGWLALLLASGWVTGTGGPGWSASQAAPPTPGPPPPTTGEKKVEAPSTPVDEAAGRALEPAKALLAQKKYPEAIAALEKFLADHAKSSLAAAARVHLGEALLGAERNEAAIKSFEEALGAKPGPEVRSAALVGLGEGLLRLKTYPRASEVLTEAFDLTTYDEKYGPLAGYFLGESLLALNKPEQAARAFYRGTRWPMHPEAPRSYYMVGEAYRRSGNLDEAALAYRTMADRYWRHPLAPQSALAAAESYLGLKKYEEAERELRRVLKDYIESSSAPRAQMGLGRLAYLQGNYNVARAAYNAAAVVFAKAGVGPEAELRIADCYLAEKNLEEATRRYSALGSGMDRLIAGEALYSLAMLHREQDKPTLAVEVFEKLLADRSTGKWSHLGGLRLAEIRGGSGDLNGAVAALKAVLAAMPGAEQADEAQFALGQALLKGNEFTAAEGEFRALLQRRPEGPFALRAAAAAARTKLGLKDATAASSECLALLKKELSPDLRAGVLTTLGHAQLQLKQDTAAVTVLKEVLEKHPTSPSAPEAALALLDHYRTTRQTGPAAELEKLIAQRYQGAGPAVAGLLNEAGKLMISGRYEEAIRLYTQSLGRVPDRASRLQARAGLAEACAALKKPAEAAAHLEEIRQDAPPTGFLARAHYRAAIALEKHGARGEALAAYRSALTAEPDAEVLGASLLATGRLLSDAGNQAEAEVALKKLVEGQPKSPLVPDALYALAWCRILTGHPSQAYPLFADLSTRFPTHPLASDALFRLAERDYAAGEIEKAAAAYARVANSGAPVSDRAGYKLGWIRLKERDFAAAAAAFQAVVDRTPRSEVAVECRVRAGEAYLQLEQDQKAAAHFDAVLASPPTTEEGRRLHLQARVGRALTYLMQGEFDRAREMAHADALPENGWYGGRAQIVSAEAVFLKSGPKAALAEYTRGASLFSRHRDVAAEAYFRAGECYEKLGNIKAARGVWQRVSDLFPETEWSRRSREKLEAPSPVASRSGK